MDAQWNPVTSSATTTCITSRTHHHKYRESTTDQCRNSSSQDQVEMEDVQKQGSCDRSRRQVMSSRVVLIATISILIISCLSINQVAAFDLGEYQQGLNAFEGVREQYYCYSCTDHQLATAVQGSSLVD